GRAGNDYSYRGQATYSGDRYGLALDRLVVQKNFNPEVGFLRRQNFRRNFASARFSPRPKNNPLIRRFGYLGSFEYTTDNDNHLETREADGEYRIDFHNGDGISVSHSEQFEFLASPFAISRGVGIPAGGYGFQNNKLSFTAGQQHKLSGNT